MRIKELRAKAREDLKGNWWSVVLPMFLYTAIVYLLGVIPDLLKDGPTKLIVGLLALAGIIIVAVAGSYAIVIRTLHIARKEEKTDFFSDVFGEGMRHGFSCAWGIFKKIWYWILIIFVGYIIMAIGSATAMVGGLASSSGPSAIGVVLVLLSFAAIVFASIKMTIASYKYYIVTYLKHDYPEKSTDELLQKSEEMMDGNKAKAFVIPMTFFGWLILAAVCGALVSIIINLILPISIWTTVLVNLITYFISSFVTAYMIMTYCEFYLERNPLEIYNEGYEKPETNAPKYKKIIGWVIGSIVAAYVLIVVILAAIVASRSNSIINQANKAYQLQMEADAAEQKTLQELEGLFNSYGE